MENPTTEEVGSALRDGPAADVEADVEEDVEGRRREAQDFLGGAAAGEAVDVEVEVEGAS